MSRPRRLPAIARTALGAALALALIALPPGRVDAARKGFEFRIETGRVLLRAARNRWEPISPGTRLVPGDILRVLPGTIATVAIDPDATYHLPPGDTVRILDDGIAVVRGAEESVTRYAHGFYQTETRPAAETPPAPLERRMEIVRTSREVRQHADNESRACTLLRERLARSQELAARRLLTPEHATAPLTLPEPDHRAIPPLELFETRGVREVERVGIGVLSERLEPATDHVRRATHEGAIRVAALETRIAARTRDGLSTTSERAELAHEEDRLRTLTLEQQRLAAITRKSGSPGARSRIDKERRLEASPL